LPPLYDIEPIGRMRSGMHARSSNYFVKSRESIRQVKELLLYSNIK